MRDLWRGNGIAISVDEKTGEVFVTNLLNPSVTVQVRHLVNAPQGHGLAISSPWPMVMGDDGDEPAVLVTRQ